MSSDIIWITALIAVAIVAAYFFAAAQSDIRRQKRLLQEVRSRLHRRGFVFAAIVPVFWLILFYSFVAHVRLTLGGWPEFGASLTGSALSIHESLVRYGAGVLIISILASAAIAVGVLPFQRLRHFSMYALAYGMAVGIAMGTMFLAPRAFLNWFFD
jgi:hypothetical protein